MISVRYLPDAAVAAVADEEVTRRVDSDTERPEQYCTGSWSAIANRSPENSRDIAASAGHVGNYARGNFANTTIAAVGYEQVARGIHRQALGPRYLRVNRGPAIAAIARQLAARDSGDDALGYTSDPLMPLAVNGSEM